jgi:hypothetical protein
MTDADRVKAALNGATGFLKLRDEVTSIMENYLSISEEGHEITGHHEVAERIIVLFSDLLSPQPIKGE